MHATCSIRVNVIAVDDIAVFRVQSEHVEFLEDESAFLPGIILEDVDGNEDVDSTAVLNVTVIHGRIAASKFLLEGGRYLAGKTEQSLLIAGG